jgi:membrane protease YdiL (CAAX protease family)
MDALAHRGRDAIVPTAVLLVAGIGLPILRDLAGLTDGSLALTMAALVDVSLLLVALAGASALAIGRAELGLVSPRLGPLALGAATAITLVALTAGYVPFVRPGLGLPAFLAAAVAIEEIVFRGVLYAALARLGGPALAISGSTAAFTLAHAAAYPARDFVLIAMAGAILGLLRLITGGLAAPIAAHFLLDLSVLAP